MSNNWRNVPCVLHEGSVRGKGYGQVWDRRRKEQIGAHVAAWESANGRDVPAGMAVMHRCDVRLCKEPSHLMLGTIADNNQDMREKGRGVNPPKLIGEKNVSAKLTEADVLQIRRLRIAGVSRSVVARQFGISKTGVTRVTTGRLWRHI